MLIEKVLDEGDRGRSSLFTAPLYSPDYCAFVIPFVSLLRPETLLYVYCSIVIPFAFVLAPKGPFVCHCTILWYCGIYIVVCALDQFFGL